MPAPDTPPRSADDDGIFHEDHEGLHFAFVPSPEASPTRPLTASPDTTQARLLAQAALAQAQAEREAAQEEAAAERALAAEANAQLASAQARLRASDLRSTEAGEALEAERHTSKRLRCELAAAEQASAAEREGAAEAASGAANIRAVLQLTQAAVAEGSAQLQTEQAQRERLAKELAAAQEAAASQLAAAERARGDATAAGCELREQAAARTVELESELAAAATERQRAGARTVELESELAAANEAVAAERQRAAESQRDKMADVLWKTEAMDARSKSESLQALNTELQEQNLQLSRLAREGIASPTAKPAPRMRENNKAAEDEGRPRDRPGSPDSVWSDGTTVEDAFEAEVESLRGQLAGLTALLAQSQVREEQLRTELEQAREVRLEPSAATDVAESSGAAK